jgi:hypothetical protein
MQAKETMLIGEFCFFRRNQSRHTSGLTPGKAVYSIATLLPTTGLVRRKLAYSRKVEGFQEKPNAVQLLRHSFSDRLV